MRSQYEMLMQEESDEEKANRDTITEGIKFIGARLVDMEAISEFWGSYWIATKTEKGRQPKALRDTLRLDLWRNIKQPTYAEKKAARIAFRNKTMKNYG